MALHAPQCLPWLLALGACATTQAPVANGGPRGLRASEHLDIAHEQDELAREQATMPARFDGPDASGLTWMRAWDTTKDHERIAEFHRGKASELHADYEQACGARTNSEVSVSPLQRYAIGGWLTSTGVIIYLRPTGTTPDAFLADMKCHRAWMMLSPTDMNDCPLDLPGIVVDARGDAEGITVSIVVRDPKMVDELHRRTARELEAAHTHDAHKKE